MTCTENVFATHTGEEMTVVTSLEPVIQHVMDVLDQLLPTVLSVDLMLSGMTSVFALVNPTGLRTIAQSSLVPVTHTVIAQRDVPDQKHVIASSAYNTLTLTSRDSVNATTSGLEKAAQFTLESVPIAVTVATENQTSTVINV